MSIRSKAITADEFIAQLPPERRARIAARAKELIAVASVIEVKKKEAWRWVLGTTSSDPP